MRTYHGIAASPGYALGPLHRIRKQSLSPPRRHIERAEIPEEIARFEKAVARAKLEIQSLIEKLDRELGVDEAGILSSQLLILEDELTWDRTISLIEQEQLNAEAAFARAVADIVLQFHDVKDPTFRERVVDLRDVEERVLLALLDREATPLSIPTRPSVVAARNLTPSEAALIGRSNVVGFILDEGGQTSHVAILARSIGVPAVLGLGNLTQQLSEGVELALDGNEGLVVVEPDGATRTRFEQLQQEQQSVNLRLEHLRNLAAVTPDGHQLDLYANVELPIEVEEVLARGAEGIGLLRTEYLYFRHGSIPSEEDQVRAYTDILERMGGRPVVFRTLDVGGDKISDYLGATREYNPFLGWRGIRFLLANRTLFKTQVRAIYRAAVAGPARLMFPMITGVEELRAAKDLCLEVAFELERDGLPHAADVPVGIMMETPSAAEIPDLLAAECDFFSIGTNDLVQYTLAMDRGNSRVAYLYRPLHPAMLRSLARIVQAAHDASIRVSLCGEMASETRFAEVLLGLGLDELSVHGAALPKIKQVVRWTPLSEAEALVAELCSLRTAAETDAYLAHYIERKKRLRLEERARS
jgi:phosphotransferase system enzyme I (PtsI)